MDSGNGLAHVRITNSHFTDAGAEDQIAKVLIDRSQSSEGQTVLELVGCRGVARDGHVLTDNVIIKGASSTKPSRLITRDCQLAALDRLIKPAAEGGTSLHFSENRRGNWEFHEGLQPDV